MPTRATNSSASCSLGQGCPPPDSARAVRTSGPPATRPSTTDRPYLYKAGRTSRSEPDDRRITARTQSSTPARFEAAAVVSDRVPQEVGQIAKAAVRCEARAAGDRHAGRVLAEPGTDRTRRQKGPGAGPGAGPRGTPPRLGPIAAWSTDVPGAASAYTHISRQSCLGVRVRGDGPLDRNRSEIRSAASKTAFSPPRIFHCDQAPSSSTLAGTRASRFRSRRRDHPIEGAATRTWEAQAGSRHFGCLPAPGGSEQRCVGGPPSW